jgi:hypothetical protein
MMVPVKDKWGRITHVLNVGQDLKRLDVVIDLVSYGEQKTRDGEPETDTADEPVHEVLNLRKLTVFSILPNQTLANREDKDLAKATKATGAVGDILLGTVAGVAGDVSGGLSPSSSLGPKLKTSAGGLSVLVGKFSTMLHSQRQSSSKLSNCATWMSIPCCFLKRWSNRFSACHQIPPL